ncbi:YkvA family protein [Afifella marina]|uniref:Uncharacterized membrane protein YkvA, DUF1232 family n=1 Tax=Afifella marina DSM 2698 TaxID=1120955 RepID=A0A1G5NNT1_AFIMA|nr:YkvA family protein [Afifella marina]MBK1624563.1 DUF1232 domain-containing protein [Afifella marina DSM 2698]MBK1627456.1 DUF1232 domain-containing protein [Afifella marina]MBK5918514.1 hypothetical protein [Afifella marina]RAI20668.1 hypothetical protein CH311_09810 [Afifella marina DSM 2698]SCZ39052.1 Uncharacterized membrane protein YkvA, DUF1232 family [Afifella marina DSM 2698]
MARTVPDIEILGPEDAADKEAEIKRRFWPTVRKALRTIPFMHEVVSAYYAMLDPRTPTRAKLTVVAALAYFVSPFDLVPDFIVGLGFLDDASVLAAALAAVSSSIREEHRTAATTALEEEVGAEA